MLLDLRYLIIFASPCHDVVLGTPFFAAFVGGISINSRKNVESVLPWSSFNEIGGRIHSMSPNEGKFSDFFLCDRARTWQLIRIKMNN